MEDVFLNTGALLCTLGGVALALLIVAILARFACNMWIETSIRFRKVFSAESMIDEYVKNRGEYLEWKQAKGEGMN